MRAWALVVSSVVFVGSLPAQTQRVVAISNSPAVRIEPGQSRGWNLRVGSASPNCRLTGRVLGLAGGKKDVDVMVMTEDDYINWLNKEHPTLMFHSGQKTAITLDIPIDGEGKYVFVVSNAFSQYSPKTVQMQHVSLACSRPPVIADDTGMVADVAAANAPQEEILPPAKTLISNEPALDIPAAQWHYWTWVVKYPRNMCYVSGRVLGLAGGQKDVDVLVMTEDDFINWSNGHAANGLFVSGHKTAVTLNVGIHGEGKYVLVVSNGFSAMSAKTVQMQNVEVSCDISPRE